jgi:hypothetical protein
MNTWSRRFAEPSPNAADSQGLTLELRQALIAMG